YGTSAEFPPLQCNLVGQWKNDPGSNMTIRAMDDKGDFTGSYYTSVATIAVKIELSPLLGSQ
ncbi:AVID protein, partial [Serilophus lunatus]|nr:AVID protein [Serilophus lunatus]